MTGFICADEVELVDAAGRIGEIDRQACRAAVEKRFSLQRVVDEHVAVFRRTIEGEIGPRSRAS